jgi:hypothetical protein
MQQQNVDTVAGERSEEILLPSGLFPDEGNLDQTWMWNSTEMEFLSFMPFIDP